MAIISSAIGPFGTIPKGRLKGLKDMKIRGHAESIKTTVSFSMSQGPFPEYWEESRRHAEACFYLNPREKPSANAGVKNS